MLANLEQPCMDEPTSRRRCPMCDIQGSHPADELLCPACEGLLGTDHEDAGDFGPGFYITFPAVECPACGRDTLWRRSSPRCTECGAYLGDNVRPIGDDPVKPRRRAFKRAI